MRTTTGMAVVLAALALGGCKTRLETQVAISGLLAGETKVIPAVLHIEVASCKDPRDPARPSSSLLNVQTHLRSVFPDAQYTECSRKDTESFASFKVPVYLDKTLDGKPASQDHINLVSNESVLLWVLVPEPVKARMGLSRKKAGASLDMDIEIDVVNDTGAAVEFAAVSTFIDGSPAVYRSMNVSKDARVALRLSDVSVQAALAGTGAPVLYHPVKK